MDLIEIIHTVQRRAAQQFSPLTRQQLNWKPAPEKWSIAQCLQHLIISDQNYFPIFDKVLQGTYKLVFFQKLNPFKKMLGAYLVKHLGPQVKKKMKAPALFQPSYSELPVDIVLIFSEMQDKVKEYFRRLQSFPVNKIFIASPVTPFIAYSLADAMSIIAAHEQRHLNQALHVLNHPEFPEE